MIHIYDTVAVAAEKLRITQQERRKHVELLVGADQSGSGVDLNIVIIIIGIDNFIKRYFDQRAAFFYLDITDMLSQFILAQIHGFLKPFLGQRLQQIIKGAYSKALKRILFAGADENQKTFRIGFPYFSRNLYAGDALHQYVQKNQIIGFGRPVF